MAKIFIPDFLKFALAMGSAQTTHALSIKVCTAIGGRWLGGRSRRDEKLEIAFGHLALLPERMPETPQARGYRIDCPCMLKCSLHGECRLCAGYHAHNGTLPWCERPKEAQDAMTEEFGGKPSPAQFGLVVIQQNSAYKVPATPAPTA